MTLITEQSNMMQIIEFRKTFQFYFVIKYYKHGNIVKICVTYDQYVIVIEQILNDLNYLHAKNIAHRDFKSENSFVEKYSFFKIVISDFDLFKTATNTSLLKNFCDTFKYFASKIFFDNNDSYEFLIDIWTLNVIDFEWLYDISDFSTVSTSKEKEKKVQLYQWHQWFNIWTCLFFNNLKNEDNDFTIKKFFDMIKTYFKLK